MTRYLLAACAALCVMPAQAQLFKCKGPDGKIVYSDQRCESKAEAAAVAPGVKNDAHGNEQRAAEAKEAAEKKAQAAAEARDYAIRKAVEADAAARAASGGAPATRDSAVSVPASSRQAAPEPQPAAASGMSYGQEERIRNLERSRGQSGNTNEQREAAQMEISSIRGGREEKLSSSDRDRRDSLVRDLDSLDPKRRSDAMRDLRSLYNGR